MKKFLKAKVETISALAISQLSMRLFVLQCKMNISIDTIIKDCSNNENIDYVKFVELVDMYYNDYLEGVEY